MFKNEYNNSFGKTYTSNVYDKAQNLNHWTLCYSLLYALSKNGMKYATETTGACSVINTTSLGCQSTIVAKPTDTSGSLKITFKQLVLRIDISTHTDGKHAYVSNVLVQNLDGDTLGTLIKYQQDVEDTSITVADGASSPVFGEKCTALTSWKNDPETDEDYYRVQTATFKDANGGFDICSMHFWALDIYLGSVSVFKAKDYFSSKYKYGFIMQRIADKSTIYRYADGSKATMTTIFPDAGTFSTKIAKLVLLYTDSFVGVIGGTNGVYAITDGKNAIDSLFPGNRVNINGCDFQAITPGLFARTS